jgi:hypothetical protein
MCASACGTITCANFCPCRAHQDYPDGVPRRRLPAHFRSPSQLLHDERSLALGIRLGILRKALGEFLLQPRIRCGYRSVGSKQISEPEVLAPEGTFQLHEVQMVRARSAAPKELPPGDALLASMLILSPAESLDVGSERLTGRTPGEQVEDRLGGEPGDAGATDVFELDGQRSQRLGKSGCLGSEEPRPLRIVADQANGTRCQTERRMHVASHHGDTAHRDIEALTPKLTGAGPAREPVNGAKPYTYSETDRKTWMALRPRAAIR